MTEKTLNNRKNGMVVLLLLVLVYVASIVLFIFGVSYDILPLTLISCVWFVFFWSFSSCFDKFGFGCSFICILETTWICNS